MAKQLSSRKLCAQPKPLEQLHDAGVSPIRLSYIFSSNKKWVNGTQITYFFTEGAEKQKNVVRKAFRKWKSLGIGLRFKEVKNAADAIVRIGFDYSDGSWSWVGRDIFKVPKNETTMNFGWDLTDEYGFTTALHEIGHTIGFQHEHQSPFSGIEWNVDAVVKEFSGPPNKWNRAQIESNILTKLSPNQVKGTTWDADSIMEYEFGPNLINAPEQYRQGLYPPGTISKADVAGVKSFYPPLKKSPYRRLKLMELAVINAQSGQQADFIFKAPATQKYTFQTVGEMDTVMVVSEKGASDNHYLSGDDDSGFNKNTKITLPLVKDREYIISVRVMYAAQVGQNGILVFQ